jgi:hypothetical protein
MTIADQVKSFLRGRSGTPYCDDCIKDKLKLHRRQQVQSVTSAIGGTTNFIRR